MPARVRTRMNLFLRHSILFIVVLGAFLTACQAHVPSDNAMGGATRPVQSNPALPPQPNVELQQAATTEAESPLASPIIIRGTTSKPKAGPGASSFAANDL